MAGGVENGRRVWNNALTVPVHLRRKRKALYSVYVVTTLFLEMKRCESQRNGSSVVKSPLNGSKCRKVVRAKC